MKNHNLLPICEVIPFDPIQVRELATEQNQDKLEQLQFPTLTFRDPTARSDGEESQGSDYRSHWIY